MFMGADIRRACRAGFWPLADGVLWAVHLDRPPIIRVGLWPLMCRVNVTLELRHYICLVPVNGDKEVESIYALLTMAPFLAI